MPSGRRNSLPRLLLLVCGAVISLTATQLGLAGEHSDEETAALLKALPNAKLSLAEGARQAAKNGEAPISAKFELDDNKKLSLSVYTAEKGLTQDAEHNGLKELSGSPEQSSWTPEAELFKDLPHVSRASEHLTLMAQSKQSLADFIGMAEKQNKGTVFSAIPEVQDHRPILVVLTAQQGKVNELRYDLQTGRMLASK